MEHAQMVRNEWSRSLRWLRSGSPLYLASAACILVGMAQILLPIYEEPDSPALLLEKFYSLVALKAYEVVLMGVALLILLWRNVTDDAVALALLIAAFLVGTAIALDTAAAGSASEALAFAIAGIVLAIYKLHLLDRYVIGRMRPLMIAGVAVLLAWNFLMPPIMGMVVRDWLNPELVLLWSVGWWVTLAGGALFLLAAARIDPDREAVEDAGLPFIATSAMRWVFVLIILAGTFMHQYALSWGFGLPLELGDLLPALLLLVLIALELNRTYRVTGPDHDFALALLPLPVVLIVIVTGGYTAGPRLHPALVSYPPLVAGVAAIAVGIAAWRLRRRSLAGVALAYLVAGLLTAGVSPEIEIDYDKLNWLLAGTALSAALAVAAYARRSFALALSAAAALAATLALAPEPALLLRPHHTAPLAVAAVVLGLALQVIFTLFKTPLARALAYAGGVLVAAGVLHTCFREASALHAPFIASLIVLAVTAGLAVWSREGWLMLPGAIPMAVALYDLLSERRGWGLVALSFVILILGAVVSLRKARPAGAAAHGPSPAPPPATNGAPPA